MPDQSILAYAGIGSTDINASEEAVIYHVARLLKERGFICYSGNAPGADTMFQEGSEGQCVIMLPWRGFPSQRFANVPGYEVRRALASFLLGDGEEGQDAIEQFHPRPEALNTWGKRALVGRDYYQVAGFATYPQVKFVVCCATPRPDSTFEVAGGTNQAVRIAHARGIPIVNLRALRWQAQLAKLIASVVKGESVSCL